MTQRIFHSISSALGLTTICCLWIVGPLVVPSHNAIYHWSGPLSTIFVPSTLIFIIVWILFSFLLLAAQKETNGSVAVWAGIAAFLPWVALKNVEWFMTSGLPHWVSRSVFGVCSILFLLLLFCVYRWTKYRAILERLRRGTIDGLSIVAFYSIIMLMQLGWFGWQARKLNTPPKLHQTTISSFHAQVSHPRIVWILLDELSYQQVYGNRFHGLKLPTFDRLAQQATNFTNVKPAGIKTEIIMPSLITGLPVDQIQPSSNGVGLELHDSVTKQWRAFDQHDTIFSDALAAGYRTAISGWYNPYCRILPEVLDDCFWTADAPATNKMLPQATISGNLLNPFLVNSVTLDRLASSITHSDNAQDRIARMHISDYQRISDSADQLLQKPAFDFILIHMALPHPSGIYNRRSHTFTTRNATYIDNLALADAYIAHVRSLLEAEAEWDSSVILIMGDHSWRTELWNATPDWNPEEQEASNGGQFDDRPGYIVKLPEQKVAIRIDVSFAALFTRRLFSAIMRKQIVSPEDLSQWVGTLDHERSKK